MRKIICFSSLLACLIACNKNSDVPNSNDGSIMTFDSLQTIHSNIPDAQYSDLVFIDEATGYAITQGFIVKTTDSGNSWRKIDLPLNTAPKKVQFTDTQNGYIIAGDNTFGVLFKTTDAEETWTIINLPALECPYGMYFLNKTTGFITGKNLFIKTLNGGISWENQHNSVFRMYQDVAFKTEQLGYVSSSNGVYFKTTDGGLHWDSMHINAANYLYDIYFTNNKTFITKSADSLVDLDHKNAITIKPNSSFKLHFFNAERAIGIGSHFEAGFYPYGDICITNNCWKTSTQKTYPTSEAIRFSTIAKMSDHKAMILGFGFSGTKILVYHW